MRKILTGCTIGILSIFINTNHASSSTIAARIASAAVVKTIGPGSTGSGVLIEVPKPNGMGTIPVIVTAAHVLKGTGKGENVDIRLYNDSLISAKGADIVFMDDIDLAFIKVDASTLRPNDHIYAKIGSSNALSIGDTIVVSGYPLESRGNVSNRVRISEGIIQTFSSADSSKSLVGYSANTFPGMSGGGVFNDKGELVYIHLKGEKAMIPTAGSLTSTPKSGTNFGISVLHAINRIREIEASKSMPTDPLARYQRGLFLVRSNLPGAALKIFSQLYREYPDSLIAEWSTKCMEVQVQHPHGQPTSWPEGELSQDKFFKKHGVKPLYWWPYFTDSAVWEEKERRVLLAQDPIYRLAKPIDELAYSNRGALVEVNTAGHCEYIPGLGSHRNRDNKEVVYWFMLANPSRYARTRNFETDPKTLRQILVPQKQN